MTTGSSILLDDDNGLTLNSANNTVLYALDGIYFNAPYVNFKSPLGEILALKMDAAMEITKSSVSMCSKFDIKGKNGTILKGTIFVTYEPFDDAPKIKEKKFPWKIVGAVLGAVALVGIAAVVVASGGMAGVVITCAVIGGVTSAATNITLQLLNGASLGELDWESVILSACSGAVGAAFAATPLSVGYQVLINSGLGATQAFLSDSSVGDIIESAIFGGIVGRLGGPGWEREFHIAKNLHLRDAIGAIRGGLMYGVWFSVVDDTIDVVEPIVDLINSEEEVHE